MSSGSILEIKKRPRWKPEEDREIENLQQRYETLPTSVAIVIQKLKPILPGRTYSAIRSRWNRLLHKNWQINEDKELINKVNGTHFETRDAMELWMISKSVSIENKSIKQCVDHWFNTLGPCRRVTKWKPEEDKKLFALLSRYGNNWKKISQYFPRRSESMLRKRSQIIDIVKNIDDSGAKKDQIKKVASMLNMYPSSGIFGERIDTLKLSSELSSPTKKSSGQSDAAKKSDLSNKWEVENGSDSRKSQINNLNEGIEPSMAKTPFPFYLFKDEAFVSSNRFPVETLFQLNLSEEDVDAFMESS